MNTSSESTTQTHRHIVVIGGSAGGVEALKQFFSLCRPDCGASFLVVQHMSPHYASQLDKVLQTTTVMPVRFPGDGEKLLRNTI